MGEVGELIIAVFKASPESLIPVLILVAIVGAVAKIIWTNLAALRKELTIRMTSNESRMDECERNISKCDEKTVMLAAKLSKIETSLEKINGTLIQLTTTMEIYFHKEYK